MSSLNSFCFTGRAGKDAEIRYLDSGTSVATTVVAVNMRQRKGEDQPPLWVQVAMWGKRAQSIADHLKKGDLIAVTGELQAPDAWVDQSGQARVRVKVNATEIQFLQSAQRAQEQSARPNQQSSTSSWDAPRGWERTAEEVPF